MTSANHFELLRRDGEARTGRLTTPHGVVRTPAFMPVGTAGAMKGMHWREVRDAGARRRTHCRARRLADLYRLARPDADRFRRLPGDVAFRTAQGERKSGHL